jgi:hypothetical protein
MPCQKPATYAYQSRIEIGTISPSKAEHKNHQQEKGKRKQKKRK